MRKGLIYLLAFALAGCAGQRDFLGNVIPPICEDAASFPLKVELVADLPVKGASGASYNACGLWLQRDRGNVALVRVAPECPRGEVIAHEKVHECMFQRTGNYRWHEEG
jgi:hypothetical protein